MPEWNDWEVFGADGSPRFVTDCEETAQQIADDHDLDYAPRGMEASGGGKWVPWKPKDKRR